MPSIPPFAQGVLLGAVIIVLLVGVIVFDLWRTRSRAVPTFKVENDDDDDLDASQEEVDLWVDVFKISLRKDSSVNAAAQQADMAVKQYNDRYGEVIDDDDTL